MPYFEKISPSVYQERRSQLKKMIREAYPNESGVLVLFANFERSQERFKQESYFYYLTGIREPGVALVMDLKKNKSILFIPQFSTNRAQWLAGALTPEHAQEYGVDEIVYLGAAQKGYALSLLAPRDAFELLLKELNNRVAAGEKLFTIKPSDDHTAIEQQLLIERFNSMFPTLAPAWVDISSLVNVLRRNKTAYELSGIEEAIRLTMIGHMYAARFIRAQVTESEIQGAIEGEFITLGGEVAFPSIVASGPNGTVLHYHENMRQMEDGELVVIDIGASFNGYCADLTRTYPVSGMFSERQKEVYELVLQTQEYIASIAKPGYWISNAQKPEKSLYHLACAFLKEKGGYDKYFFHGIGHYLGLDVHDVGSYAEPLALNDVITIEPGIYLKDEGFGIRIEDNYVVRESGVECLSHALPKTVEDVESFIDSLRAMNINDPDEEEEEAEGCKDECCQDDDECEEQQALG